MAICKSCEGEPASKWCNNCIWADYEANAPELERLHRIAQFADMVAKEWREGNLECRGPGARIALDALAGAVR